MIRLAGQVFDVRLMFREKHLQLACGGVGFREAFEGRFIEEITTALASGDQVDLDENPWPAVGLNDRIERVA